MRGSSAKSLTAVLSVVGGVTGVKAASALGAELFAVTATLDREVALRRV